MLLNLKEFKLTEPRPQVRYVSVAADDAGMRLDNYLLRLLKDVPKSHVYRIVRSGEVRVNRGRAKPGTRLAADDRIRVPPVRVRARGQQLRPPDALKARVQAAIVAETDDWIVFNKPPGLAVHGGSGLAFGLIEVLRAMRPDSSRLELVHRLDRHTSGCLLVAKSRATLDYLRAGLRAKTCAKRYLALVDGVWRDGVCQVDVPLSRDRERGGERMVVADPVAGRRALSDFVPVDYFPHATLMRVRIHTGRTHQIRVHAAHCGHPIAADAKYAANARCAHWRRLGLERMFLHALEITMPTADGDLRFNAPLAEDLRHMLDALRARQDNQQEQQS